MLFFDRKNNICHTSNDIYYYFYFMFEKISQRYYRFFDETIESSTFVVLFITMIIFCVWAIIPSTNAAENIKWNVLELKLQQDKIQKNVILIEWVKYEVSYSRID